MVDLDIVKSAESIAETLEKDGIDVSSLVETKLGDTLSGYPEGSRLLLAVLLSGESSDIIKDYYNSEQSNDD